MNDLLFSLNIILPLSLFIALGYVLTYTKLWDASFLKTANSICYKVLFPILLFYNIAHSKFDEAFNWRFVLYVLALVTALIVLALLIVPLFVRDNDRRAVLIQAIFRSNYMLFAAPLCQAVYGEAGAATAAILAGFIVPYYNLVGTLLFDIYQTGRVKKPFLLVLRVFKNPLMLGSLCGMLAVLVGLPLPASIDRTLYEIKSIATPFALLVLGGGFQMRSFRKNLRPITIIGFFRLLFIPALVFLLSVSLGYQGVELIVLLSVFASPVSVTIYVMACEIGGDYELAGQLLVFTSLASVPTIFFSIFYLRAMGYLPPI